MAEINLEVFEDNGEWKTNINDLADVFEDVIRTESRPEALFEDVGIGGYEYWGCSGFDSRVEISEVNVEPVTIELGFGDVSDEIIHELCLTTPEIVTWHGDNLLYQIAWTGIVGEHNRSITYTGKRRGE